MRLAKRLAFLCFDNSSGIIKGEQPLIRASRASKVAGAFLVLFWHAKENLALPKEQFDPRHIVPLFLISSICRLAAGVNHDSKQRGLI